MNGKRLSDRPTPDLIVIFLTGLVGAVIIITLVTVAVSLWLHPEEDVTASFRFVANLINTIVGGIIGFIAGRKVNGNSKNGQ